MLEEKLFRFSKTMSAMLKHHLRKGTSLPLKLPDPMLMLAAIIKLTSTPIIKVMLALMSMFNRTMAESNFLKSISLQVSRVAFPTKEEST
jgi:hypothetical protein